jgi:cell division protein FtsQ
MIRQRKVNRLNADRVAKHRAIRRLLAGTFGVLVLAASVVWGVAELHDSNTLPLRSVHLKGEFIHVTEKELREIVASSDLAGFFSSDLEGLASRLRNMPWVEAVAVRRVWPDALHITVIEQQAVAYWNDNALLNGAGQTFSPVKDSYPHGLTQFNGPEGTEMQMLERYLSMRAILQAQGRDIDELILDARRAWQLKLDNGISLALGRSDGQQRLQRFTRAYANFLNNKQETISTVDLRYTNGFAVRWQTPEENAAQADMGMKSHVQKS